MGILLKTKRWSSFIFIFIGVSLMAVCVRVVYEPLELVTGGISGFAIVVRYWTKVIIDGGVPLWITNAIINVPLFIAGWFLKGRSYILKSFFATVLFTAELSLIPNVPLFTHDYVMASVFGGVLMGIGLGLVVISSSSTGGTDLLGAIIRRYFPEYSIATMLLGIDTIIVLLGAAAFGLHNALYAVVAVYITTKVMDTVVSGIRYSKLIFIITDKEEPISKQLIDRVGRGVTSMNVRGMYSGTDKSMLICAVSRRESIQVIKIVDEIDGNAFMMISDVKEILGEGFVETVQYLN